MTTSSSSTYAKTNIFQNVKKKKKKKKNMFVIQHDQQSQNVTELLLQSYHFLNNATQLNICSLKAACRKVENLW
jgi:hypothetical protein